MISEKQLAANRANAQRSTGPRNESGKQRSRLNATRHGLTGQVMVLPEEDMAAFNKFSAEIVESLRPAGAHERQLAQSYASFQWRINRIAGVEDTMFALGVMEKVAENLNIEHAEAHNAVSYAKTFRDDSAAFARLSLYSQRMVNQAEKVFKQLKQVQAERREREAQEMRKTSAPPPARQSANGFVFSAPQPAQPSASQNPDVPQSSDQASAPHPPDGDRLYSKKAA